MAVIKVAVLDDYQGFSESSFSQLDSCKYSITKFKDTFLPYNHPDTPQAVKDELATRLEPFQIICTMRERTPFPKELISRLPNLKLLLTSGLRNASLDLSTFKEHGIPVAGSVDKSRKDIGTDSTTQHTVALILSLARNIPDSDADMKSGLWQTSFATGLSGKTLGVVGLGRLGVTTARIMSVAFGMKVVAWSANLTQKAADEKARDAGLPVEGSDGEKTFKVVSRDELFSTADVVSIHLVLSDRSRGLITSADLSKMKTSSFFINTSRGPLVVEKDLLNTLKAGGIRGAAVDVFDVEPLPINSEWRSEEWGKGGRSRVVVTPHMGYVEPDHISDWYAQQVENIKRWEAGEALVNVLA